MFNNSKLFSYAIFILGLTFIIGCSSSVPEIRTTTKISEGIYKDDIRLNVKQIYAWVNLMPGAKARFHVTGSIELLEDSKFDLENVTIKKINIIQNNNTIYQFTPKTEENLEENKKSILFSSIRGLLYTSILKKENTIDVELLLSDSSNEIIYLIPSVEISEVH
ncbi:MAG: hypothetical protein L3J41_05200 [Melioribacteraceae bacterium]|nr:hypothetical protein [Melioribacteraceae bacterium]